MLVQRPYRDDNIEDEEVYGLDAPSTRSRVSIEVEDEIIQTPQDRRRKMIRYVLAGTGLVIVALLMTRLTTAGSGANGRGESRQIEGFHSRQELRLALSEYLVGDKKAIIAQYGSIDKWDVKGVADFTQLFDARRLDVLADFNEDISNWDMSNAKLLTGMFYGSRQFNQDLTYWNVSGVTHFNGTLERASVQN